MGWLRSYVKDLAHKEVNKKLTQKLVNEVTNAPHNLYKNTVPANVRMLVKSVVNPTKVTEANFTQKELGILKESHTNSLERSNGKIGNEARMRAAVLTNSMNSGLIYSDTKIPSTVIKGKKVTVEQEVEELLPQVYSKSLQYQDYPKGNFPASDNHPISSSLLNKPYTVATTVGRANYTKDKQGNTHVVDTYDFGNIDPASKAEFDKLSPLYKTAERLGNKYGKAMPVDINLGKGK